MVETLHQLLSSDPRAVADCLLVIQAGDRLMLADAGVNLLDGDLAGLTSNLPTGCEVSVSRHDVSARGLEARAKQHGVSMISDVDWVQLVSECRVVLSWK